MDAETVSVARGTSHIPIASACKDITLERHRNEEHIHRTVARNSCALVIPSVACSSMFCFQRIFSDNLI